MLEMLLLLKTVTDDTIRDQDFHYRYISFECLTKMEDQQEGTKSTKMSPIQTKRQKDKKTKRPVTRWTDRERRATTWLERPSLDGDRGCGR